MSAYELVTLIPWAIKHLTKDEYLVKKRDPSGVPVTIELDAEYGILHVEIIEGALASPGVMSPERSAALFSLKNGYTPESLQEAMTALFSVPFGPILAKKLLGASWGEIITYVDWLIRFHHNQIGEKLAERESFSGLWEADLEEFIDIRQPGFIRSYVAEKYARELAVLYPQMVERATSLRMIGTLPNHVPADVSCYLTEASRSFIYGNFLASLMVCRSAIETAIEDRLRKIGCGSELDKMEAEHKKTLDNMLRMEQSKELLGEVSWYLADKIRKLAKNAVHGKRLPSDSECVNALDDTRQVLEKLYGKSS